MNHHNPDVVQREPGLFSTTSLIQIGYGVWVNLTLLGVGLALGFSSVSGPQMLEGNSLIKATISERAWIASGLTVASPLGCIICGVLADRFGRRLQLVLCQLPLVIGWACTATAASALQIIIGRVISGVGIGMCSGIPRLYVTEITLPRMRGLIGAFSNIAISLGITVQAAIGAYLDWKIISYVCCAYSAIVMFSNFLLPETPYYVLFKYPDNAREVAVKAIRKFRSKNYDIRDEIEHLMEYKDVNQIRRLAWKEKICFLFIPTVCKPFWIMVIYILCGHLAGITVVSYYTIEILKESMSTVDPSLGNFILGVSRLVSGILTSVLLYKVGKKPLAFTSSLGMGITTLIIGLYIKYAQKPGVYTQICYTLYVMFAALGYFTLPLILMYELYPLQARGLLGGLTISILNLIIFGVTRSYPHIRKVVDLPYIIFGFSVIAFIGCIFIFFCLPETKGLTLQEIEEYFNSRRSTLASERAVHIAQLEDIRKKSSTLSRNSSFRKSLDRHTVDQISHRSQSSRQSRMEVRSGLMKITEETHETDKTTSAGIDESDKNKDPGLSNESQSSKTSFEYSYENTVTSNYDSDAPEAQHGAKKKSKITIVDDKHKTKRIERTRETRRDKKTLETITDDIHAEINDKESDETTKEHKSQESYETDDNPTTHEVKNENKTHETNTQDNNHEENKDGATNESKNDHNVHESPTNQGETKAGKSKEAERKTE